MRQPFLLYARTVLVYLQQESPLTSSSAPLFAVCLAGIKNFSLPLLQSCYQHKRQHQHQHLNHPTTHPPSYAGFLSILSCARQEALREEIQLCKSLTNEPFAVNLTLLPALVGLYIQTQRTSIYTVFNVLCTRTQMCVCVCVCVC